VTGCVAENRAAPESLAHAARDTPDLRRDDFDPLDVK
jgi:hypothetical protein